MSKDMEHSDRSPSRWVTLALFLTAVLLLWVPFSRYWLLFLWMFSNRVESDQTRFQIPGTAFELEHRRWLVGLCDFDRTITFYSNGKPGVTTWLGPDFAGGYPINCYLIQTPTRTLLRTDDRFWGHYLDLTNQKTYSHGHLQCELREEAEFVDPDSRSGDADKADLRAPSISSLTEGTPETYIGTLGGALGELKFYPASKLPAPKIIHQDE